MLCLDMLSAGSSFLQCVRVPASNIDTRALELLSALGLYSLLLELTGTPMCLISARKRAAR
jgi:hypothetical protein